MQDVFKSDFLQTSFQAQNERNVKFLKFDFLTRFYPFWKYIEVLVVSAKVLGREITFAPTHGSVV